MLKSETSNSGCFKRYFWLQSLFQTQHQLNNVQVLNFNTRQIIAPDEGRKCSRQLLVSWPINILLQSQPTQAWIQIIQFHVKDEPDVLHAGSPFNSSATCISHCMLTWTPELCLTKYTHDNFHIFTNKRSVFHQFLTGAELLTSGRSLQPTFCSSFSTNIQSEICCKRDKRQFWCWQKPRQQNNKQPLDMLWTLTCFRVEKLALLLLLSLSLLHSPPTQRAKSWIQQVCACSLSGRRSWKSALKPREMKRERINASKTKTLQRLNCAALWLHDCN